MLQQVKYVNHLNQTIMFGSDGIFINTSELLDYSWSYDSNFEKVSNFRKKIAEKATTVTISADTYEECNTRKNRVFEVFERDVLAEKPGRFYIGGYYYLCYIAQSKKPSVIPSKKCIQINVTVVSDSPVWIRETDYEFLRTEGEAAETQSEYLKIYPYDYGAGYYYQNLSNSSGTIVNSNFLTSDFIMRIYGEVTNPLINIGANTYKLNVRIPARCHAEINSEKKTIRLIKANGEAENIIWMADKDSYIFEKIPTGASVVGWNNNFTFKVTIINRRSEPKWM